MENNPLEQAIQIIQDLDSAPKPLAVQAVCDHEMWLCYMPSGMATCRKCGFSRPITEEEWENF